MPQIMKVGLDVSMNSTGLVIDIDHKITIHKIISEMKGRHSSDCKVHSYDRIFSNDDYSIENISKIISAEKLANKIAEIIHDAFMDSSSSAINVRMEGSAMGGFGMKSRVDDMTNFSAIVKRKMISTKQVQSISIIPPTTLKKFATGKGNAKKDAILESFYLLFPEFEKSTKDDDIADAYFLSQINSDVATITTWKREDYENVYKYQTTTKSIADTKPVKVKKVKRVKKTPKVEK